METFNQLEEHVLRLISETEHLRQEHERLQQNATLHETALNTVKEENRLLKEALVQEQQIKEDVLKRIDALLERLKDLEQA